MLTNPWSSVRIIFGGSIIALIAVALGVINWDVPYWFIHVVSVLFVFSSAILHQHRIYLYIVLIFIVAHLGVDLYISGRSFLLGSWLPQNYDITFGTARVADLKQNFNLFRYELNLDFTMDTAQQLDRRLGIAAGILLAAVEGKQSN